LRILFTIKWPLRTLNRGRHGIQLEIDWVKFTELYPFFINANFCKPAKSVNQKRKPNTAEQAIMYRKLLKSGKVKSKADIARKFGVSRAWVTKVLK